MPRQTRIKGFSRYTTDGRRVFNGLASVLPSIKENAYLLLPDGGDNIHAVKVSLEYALSAGEREAVKAVEVPKVEEVKSVDKVKRSTSKSTTRKRRKKSS